MKNRDKLIKILIFLAFIAGIAIKLYYIHYTQVWERQHDVIGFGADEGQAAYIEYLLENRHFPDFDPRTKWGFFQPPLHHILSAVMIYVSTKLGANYGRATENIQFLTCFYMIAVTVIMAAIYLRASKGEKNKIETGQIGLFIALCVAGIHPIFTILSGSINNDGLSLVLAVLALMLALSWYENPNIVRIVGVALAIGLSMMAKLTGGLVAVPIGILFLIKLVSVIKEALGGEKGELKNTVCQYIIFAIVVFPTGLWWTIRNMKLWNMPVSYIPGVGEIIPDSISTVQRLFDIRTNSIYCSLINSGADYDEYCIPLALLKTSIFGEWDFGTVSRWIKVFAIPLFVLAIALLTISVIATFYMTFSKNSELKLHYKIVLFGTWVTYLLAYISFAISYRNFSAQDFRYGAICIICEGIYLGLFTESIKSNVLKRIILFSSAAFGVCSVMVYFIIGFKA